MFLWLIEILDICKKYGVSDRTLWIEALTYFASKEADCRQYILEVLTHIEQKNLLPPLMVINALAANSTASLAIIKARRLATH